MLELLTEYLPNNLLGTVIVLVLTYYMVYEYRKQRGLPPGPYGIPFIGYSVFLDRTRMGPQITELCKQYNTNILSFTMFGETIVILNDLDTVKELFQKRTDFADRPNRSLFQAFDKNVTGIIATSGRIWKEARRFSISMLRDFGMGRIGAEERIHIESEILVDLFKRHLGKAFDAHEYINVAVSNIICGMVFGKRFEIDDEEFRTALDGMNNIIFKMNSTVVVFILRTRIGKFLFHKKYTELKNDYDAFHNFVAKRIEEHKNNYTGEVTDLIYGFLQEMEGTNDKEVFNDQMLQSLIQDFFLAGSETTYTTIRWALLAMAVYPEIQKKVQEELDQLHGHPKMNEKKYTPYTEAVLNEIMRYCTLLPVGGPPHSSLNGEAEFHGYRLPQKCVVFPNFYNIHSDPKTWKYPKEFNPENFLENGEVVNADKLIPFGIGRRSCAGEVLARMELYIVFATIVKAFNILPEEGVELKMEGLNTLVFQPKPYKVRMIPRN